MSLPEVSNRLKEEGTEVVASTPDEFAQKIRSDMAKWAKVIKQAGIQPQ